MWVRFRLVLTLGAICLPSSRQDTNISVKHFFYFQERDSLNVLWQTSQKTIDALDIELKTYQSYNSRGGNKVKIKFINIHLGFILILHHLLVDAE